MCVCTLSVGVFMRKQQREQEQQSDLKIFVLKIYSRLSQIQPETIFPLRMH